MQRVRGGEHLTAVSRRILRPERALAAEALVEHCGVVQVRDVQATLHSRDERRAGKRVLVAGAGADHGGRR